MTRATYVLLVIRDDDPERPWWEALCLPSPERWNIGAGIFAPNVYVQTRLEVEGK